MANAKNLLVVVFAGLTIGVHAREFKSADGKQTLDAEFVRYHSDSGKVTLRIAVGRNLAVPASKFSEQEIEYFLQEQKIADQKSAISVKVKEDKDRVSSKTGNLLYKRNNVKLVFTINNTSEFPFNDLKMDYWVLIERDNKGEEAIEILKESEEIAYVTPSGQTVIEGPTVNLTLGAASVCKTGCPKVAVRAASIGRDRIIGTKVEVRNASGDLIYTDSSSMRIRALLLKDERPPSGQ